LLGDACAVCSYSALQVLLGERVGIAEESWDAAIPSFPFVVSPLDVAVDLRTIVLARLGDVTFSLAVSLNLHFSQ